MVILVAIAYAFWLGSVAVRRNVLSNQRISALKQTVEQKRIANEQLKLEIAYEQTDTYKEKELRRRLGYKKPGEVVIIMPENADPITPDGQTALGEPSASPLPSSRTTKANYRLWWEYFFGTS